MKASSNQEDINSKWTIPHQRHYFLLTSTKQRENKIITAVKRERNRTDEKQRDRTGRRGTEKESLTDSLRQSSNQTDHKIVTILIRILRRISGEDREKHDRQEGNRGEQIGRYDQT